MIDYKASNTRPKCTGFVALVLFLAGIAGVIIAMLTVMTALIIPYFFGVSING